MNSRLWGSEQALLYLSSLIPRVGDRGWLRQSSLERQAEEQEKGSQPGSTPAPVSTQSSASPLLGPHRFLPLIRKGSLWGSWQAFSLKTPRQDQEPRKGAEQSEESPENDVIEVKRKDCSRKSCGLESQILLKSEGMRGLRSVLWISNKEPVRHFPNSTFRRVLGAAECGEWKVRTWMTIQQMTFGEKESTKAH